MGFTAGNVRTILISVKCFISILMGTFGIFAFYCCLLL